MERKKLIEELEQRLAHWDRELRSLEQRLAQADPAQREEFGKEIQTLHGERREAEEHLLKARTDDAEAWARDDIGKGLLRIFDNIGTRMEHLFSRAP